MDCDESSIFNKKTLKNKEFIIKTKNLISVAEQTCFENRLYKKRKKNYTNNEPITVEFILRVKFDKIILMKV